MNGLIAQLLAVLTALSAAIGSPANANKLPDRPAIVQSAPAAPKSVGFNSNSTNSTKPSDDSNKTLDNSTKLIRVEIQGAIVSVQTNGTTKMITVGGQTVTVDAATRVEGKLDVGANVRIEAFKQATGSLVASRIEVKKIDITIRSSDDKSTSVKAKTDEAKKDDNSIVKSGDDDLKFDDKSAKSGSDDSPSHDVNDDKGGSSSLEDSKLDDDKSGDDKGGNGSSDDSKSGDDKSDDDKSGDDSGSGHR